VQAIGRQPQRAPDGAPPHYECHRPEQTTLYRLVQEHAASFIAHTEASTGSELPQFIKAEFDAFLECGILAHGFLRLRCGECGHDKLLAFSCKRRGFCPSCGVTSHHNPATRFRHIPASWQGANEHLAGPQEWPGFVLLTTLVHDGIGVWLAARRLNSGKFVWPKDGNGTLTLSRAQFDALVVGLPWQRIGEAGVITVSNGMDAPTQ